MVYEIEFSRDAERQLKSIAVHYQRKIRAEAKRQLRHQPDIPTGNRKPLRQPNVLDAEWELRVQPYRVYYNV